MNYQEIKQQLVEKFGTPDTIFANNDFCPNNWGYDAVGSLNNCGLGKVVQVESDSESDYGGSSRNVFHFTDHNVYVIFSGWYSSYDGHTFDQGWDNVYEGQPVEKIIIVYEVNN